MRNQQFTIRCIIYILILVWGLPYTSYGQPEQLTLSDAITKALQSNYGISISEAEYEVAAVNNDWGVAGRYPTISFNASASGSPDLSDQTLTNRISAGVALDWTLFNGFRVNITKSQLETSELLASGRLGVMVENTVEDVIMAYYAVLLEAERLEVLRSVMELSRDRYDYVKQKRLLGSSVTYEVLQAENIYLSDKASLYDQEMRVRNAKRNFNFILAEYPEKQWDFSENFTADTSRYVLADLKSKMVENNQTLKNQYTNLMLKQDETELRKAAFYPTLVGSLGMDVGNTRSHDMNNAINDQVFKSYAPYASVRLSYNIYQGGVRKRAMQVAQINEQIAETGIEQMEHALTNELYNLFDYHEVRIQLLQLAEQSVATAELNLQISEEKYRTGVINSFNYRDVQLIYLEASLRRLQAIYNLVDSKTQLSRITGGFLNQGQVNGE